MGFRFRKSIKLLPGVRLNLNKNSTSVSFGGRGARYTVSSTGKRTASVGIPGTGLSYSTTTGGKKRSQTRPQEMPKLIEMMECPNCGMQIEATAENCTHCQSKILRVGGGQFVELWPSIPLLWALAMALHQLTSGTWEMFYIFLAVAAVFVIVLAAVKLLRPRIGDPAIVKEKWRFRLWFILPIIFICQVLLAALDIVFFLM